MFKFPKAEWFIVCLDGRQIDKVQATGYDIDEMRRSLINHDGYDPRIIVFKEDRPEND
jgi:hypothetical protein